MTNLEFINEVSLSGITPDNFDVIYREFQEYQAAAIRTLCEFHRICEKNGVSYQLAYGSLLGAVRDNGMIPWDYDIDVFVPHEQRSRLVSLLRTELSQEYYFYGAEVDRKCNSCLIRIAPVEYTTDELHIDVFFFTGTSNNEEERIYEADRISRIADIRFDKYLHPIIASHGNYKSLVIYLLRKARRFFVRGKKILDEYEILCNKHKLSDSEYAISTASFARKHRFRVEDIKETMLFSTSNGKFRVPLGYKNVLYTIYGNYDEIPPLSDRMRELLNSYNRLHRYAKRMSYKHP